MFTAATQEELDAFWTVLLAVDKEFHLHYTDSIGAKDLSPHLAEFLAHCYRQRHYYFDTLKCRKSDCKLCLPQQLLATEFTKSGHLPDPVPGTDDHYKPLVKFSIQQKHKSIIHLPNTKLTKKSPCHSTPVFDT